MFGRFSGVILNSLLKKKWLFAILFVGIVATLILGVSKLRVDEDVYSIFPKGKEYSQFSDLLKKNNLNKQVIFSFDANEDVDLNYDNLDRISEELIKKFSKELSDFQVYKDVNQEALISHLQTTSISYLSDADYQRIENSIQPDSIEVTLTELNAKLQGASTLFLGSYYSKDPLNLLGRTVQKIGVNQDNKAYEVEDGIVYSTDKKRIFFFANLTIDSKNSEELVAFEKKLTTFKASNKDLKFDYFGTFQIAVENAVQVKKDTFITLSISLVLIVALLIFYYRSILIPIVFVFPAAFGMLSGLGFVGFIQPEISAISIGTSSILLGIVLDYTFHFLTHYKHSGSLIETVKDIASPMLIGSFTTVAAFASLLFTDSIVLQNFGLIALFTLLGSALFTLFLFPVVLAIFRVKMVERELKFPRLRPNKLVFRLTLLAIIGFTFFSLFYSKGVNFDADLNNLSFHSDELKQKEDAFTNINPGEEKKIYIFSKGKTIAEANRRNEQVFRTLVENKENLKISEIVSTAAFNPSKVEFEKSKQRWINFWSANDSIKNQIIQKSGELGFSETAFNPFYSLLENPEMDESKNWLSDLGMQNFIHNNGDEVSILTSVVVDRKNLEICKAKIKEIEGNFILDISEVASNMLDGVQKDFNFLLYFSSLLVLLSLLVVYGRIELALFAFFPMLLAWVWILGITSIFDIHFNFVNILIATFIFGLGDDFSIFVTDGLIQKYKTGKDSLKSYKSAIVLSGLTTIFGTGCLYFAKHPAIHSIAIISVVGILTILFITLAIQPVIFNWFVTRRTKKGRGPITFLTFLYSLMLFTYFFLGSMFLSIFLIFILIPLPIKRKKKVKTLNYVVSKLAKSTLYAGFQVKKKVLDSTKLNYDEPSIIIANHGSFLDILAVLMLDPKTIIMVKKWVYNSPVFGLFIRYSGYIFAEEGAEGNLDTIKQRISDGYSIVIFPEGTRSPDGEIKRFHKGAFLLSLELNLPIQPLLLIGIHEVNPKNDVMINRGTILVQPLDKLYPIDYASYQIYSKHALNYMREQFDLTKRTHAKTDFWFPQIIRNFVLKGPVLEWYVRVKFQLEKKSFEYYDELIADRKRIYDVGCGYGYLSYYFHYRNKKREIIGLDYDEEKAMTAQNALRKNENLQFVHADLRQFRYENADAIFINDVLRYLPKNEQYETLQTMVESLNENGILFIRDGIVDIDRIKNTQRTEQLSTKLFKFNKVENELTFIAVEEMKAFATENKLSFEMIEHSKTTSNVLFVLRK